MEEQDASRKKKVVTLIHMMKNLWRQIMNILAIPQHLKTAE